MWLVYYIVINIASNKFYPPLSSYYSSKIICLLFYHSYSRDQPLTILVHLIKKVYRVFINYYVYRTSCRAASWQVDRLRTGRVLKKITTLWGKHNFYWTPCSSSMIAVVIRWLVKFLLKCFWTWMSVNTDYFVSPPINSSIRPCFRSKS